MKVRKKSNRKQNQEFRYAVHKIGRKLNRQLTRDQESWLHREVSNEGYNLETIVQIGEDMWRGDD